MKVPVVVVALPGEKGFGPNLKSYVFAISLEYVFWLPSLSGFAATCRPLMNTVAATPMSIRHASLAINRLRCGATDCESSFSAKGIFDSFRPSRDVPENQLRRLQTYR